MDKPMYKSLTVQGGGMGSVGAALLLIGEPLSKGIHPDVLQWIGYVFVIFGALCYLIGERRSRGNLIMQTRGLNEKITDLQRSVQTQSADIKSINNCDNENKTNIDIIKKE
jgi:hypothetical protein